MKGIKNEPKDYTIFDTKQALFSYIASELKRYSLMSSEQHICLLGGSTPKGLFAYILDNTYVHTINWNNLHFWWGDERCVPSTDSQSNFGEAKRLFFNRIEIDSSNIHPINIIESKHEDSLKQFKTKMESDLTSSSILDGKNNYPVFDWILLGVGEDGHAASLFPNVTNLESPETALLVLKPETQEYRISLSANTIRTSKRISYLLTGESKAEVSRDILTLDAASKKYPAALISSQSGQTQYFLDQEAGSLLPTSKQTTFQTRGSCQ